jgi:hypothetical protein
MITTCGRELADDNYLSTVPRVGENVQMILLEISVMEV